MSYLSCLQVALNLQYVILNHFYKICKIGQLELPNNMIGSLNILWQMLVMQPLNMVAWYTFCFITAFKCHYFHIMSYNITFQNLAFRCQDPKFQKQRILGYLTSRITEFQDSRIPEFHNSRIPELQDSRMAEFFNLSSWIPGIKNSRNPEFQDSSIPEFQNYRIPELQDFKIPGFQNSMISVFQDIRITGFLNSRIPVF